MQHRYQKRIIFFVEPEWAFGSVHVELTKYLFAKGINTAVLPWTRDYTPLEMTELGAHTHLFISTPFGAHTLINIFGIAPEKCVAVAHAVLDLIWMDKFPQSTIDRFYKYAVVSNWLLDQNNKMEILRLPTVVPIGINYNNFFAEPSQELNTVGFAGAWPNTDASTAEELTRPGSQKRGRLVEQVCKQIDMPLKIAQKYNNSFITMPGFYNSVDAVIVASTEEGAGLPALEASAAGRLVISTPVGLWKELAGDSGHTVPVDEADFVQETTALLNFYRQNSDAYRLKCIETQQHARRYDWSNVIDLWVELLS